MSSTPASWAPMVSGTTAAAALERVARLAGEPRATPSRVRHDLGGGGAGLAVVCGQLDRLRPGRGWDVMAWGWLDAAEAGAGRPGGAGPGLFGGSGGPVFAGWVLRRGRPREGELRGGEAWLASSVVDLEAVSRTGGADSGRPRGRDLDLVSGLTGICTNLLCDAVDPDGRRTLLRGLAALCRFAEPGVWRYLGVAHGMAGPLALLSRASLAGIRVPGQLAAVERLVALLAEYRRDDDRGPNWPVGTADPRPVHGSWCAGAAGIAGALWAAGRALDDATVRGLATDTLTGVLARPAAERLVDRAPGLCHGLAGLLQITLRFAWDTGDPAFRTAAGVLTEELLDRHPAPAAVAGPGLLDGAAGVILALLAATTPTPPEWDRALLLG